MAAALPPSSRVTCLRGTSPDPPSHLGRARKGDHREPRILHQLRHLLVGGGEHRPGTRRELRLREELTEQKCAQGGGERGLDDHRRADRDRRCHFVGDEVEREVERCDREHRPTRESADHRQASLAALRRVEPHQLTTKSTRFLCGDPKRRDRLLHLRPRPPDRLAVLGGDELGDLGAPARELGGDLVERTRSDQRREVRQRVLDRVRRSDRQLELLGVWDGDVGDMGPVGWMAHRQPLAA